MGNLNTFARNIYDAHFEDPVHAEWQAGDFTSHCTGLRKQLREGCIADSIEAADNALAAFDCSMNRTRQGDDNFDKQALSTKEVDYMKAWMQSGGGDTLADSQIRWFKPSLISI